MHASRRTSVVMGLLALMGVLGPKTTAWATVQTDRMVFRAGVAVQNTFHHDSFSSIDWVQQRNELRAELKYRLIPRAGSFGFLDVADFNMLYRGRYDSIFDIRDAYRKRGYDRDDFRFPEGKLPRELFLDFGFNGLFQPLSLRLGKQQIVWGEADLFRSIDVVNPLRLDQNGIVGEDLSDYREPLWIAKALVDIGQLGPVAETGLELFYSPNWRPLTDRVIVGESFRIKLDHTRPDDPNHLRRNQLPFNQVRHPWEVTRVGPYSTEAGDGADTQDGPNRSVAECREAYSFTDCADADFVYLIDSKQVPTSVLDLDASMVGVRLLGKTWGGLDFTMNYLFKRTEVPGTALPTHLLFDPDLDPNTPVVGNTRQDVLIQAAEAQATGQNLALRDRCLNGNPRDLDLDPNDGPLSETTPNLVVLESMRGYEGRAFTGCLTVPFWYPWTHIFGFTLTYNDYNYTGMIFRLEQSYSTKEPRNGQPALAGVRAGEFPQPRDFETSGKRSTQVWRSMVGFDYLRAFPQYMPSSLRPYKYLRTWFMDQWFFTFQFLNEYYSHADAQIGLLDSITDRMQHWNPVFTFVATGFFLNNVFRPWIAAGYDVNAQFPILWLQGTYFLTSQIELRIGEIMYLGSQQNESFIFLHKYADRDTLFVRFRYWFL